VVLDSIEWKLRRFGAAFFITPQFRNWVRTRARELERAGQPFEIVLVWGRRRFHVGNLPHGDPYFAIERADGQVERSRWAG
jgi:hypothetical protein